MKSFVKIQVGDAVFDVQRKLYGEVKEIDHTKKIAVVDLVTADNKETVQCNLASLVVVASVNKKNSNNLDIKVKYFNPDLTKLTKITQGDWIDLRTAETIELKAGEFKLIPLGVAMKLPEDYEAVVAPRSSTFKNYGVLQTNSFGLIDNSYSGNDDQWFFPAYALRDTAINFDERICQFRIQKRMPEVSFTEVDKLDDVSRGGHGSTGVK